MKLRPSSYSASLPGGQEFVDKAPALQEEPAPTVLLTGVQVPVPLVLLLDQAALTVLYSEQFFLPSIYLSQAKLLHTLLRITLYGLPDLL